MKKIISIAGTLGVGKSTFTKLLAKEMGYKTVFENPEKNPFLALFYKDMKRWAFHSQMFFLLEKIKLLNSIALLQNHVIQDTPIYEDVFSYAQAQFKMKHMTIHEWNLYKKTYLLMKKQCVDPSLIIYLYAPIEIIYDRIKQRDRIYETSTKKNIFIKYLRVLDRLNAQWIREIKKTIPVLLVDTTKIHYMTDYKDLQNLILQIAEIIKKE